MRHASLKAIASNTRGEEAETFLQKPSIMEPSLPVNNPPPRPPPPPKQVAATPEEALNNEFAKEEELTDGRKPLTRLEASGANQSTQNLKI